MVESRAPSARGRRPGLRRDDPRLRAWRALLHAHASVMRRLEAELVEEQGMTLAEYDALVHLAVAPERRLRMGELADQVLLSRSGVSRLVDRLEHDGLVERSRCAPDARGAYAVLTERGLARLRSATPVHLAGVREHFLDALGAADLPVLERALASVAAANGRPVPAPARPAPAREADPPA
jgi:DNA-binding MarR family transcriptional regulator